MRVGEQSTDPIDQILGEVPVPASLTPEDVRLAVRAVVVHAAEEWPAGPKCRNDGSSFPCRLHRWGRRVLETHGLNDRQIDALIRHGNPFVHVPFPFVLTGTSGARPTPGPVARPAGQAARPAAAAQAARGPVPRVAAPPVRPGLRPVAGRPAPATRPRWPRAS
ncbi:MULTISPECIES: hypothetical protein [unclassified Micromonospora]|uniref:hypothetical protein n=1 Tax=unclassified Micromonospora TaxID=2617518 RepID=UPI001C21840E|nr:MULTISPECIES: hypothetical protein [unclassified Micromonospora]MBU8859128.1 hypothetical protein [Micromonospora sp. WMMB482]MDM4778637.1 hypothetical protein [Micromonospora sp. b486]